MKKSILLILIGIIVESFPTIVGVIIGVGFSRWMGWLPL